MRFVTLTPILAVLALAACGDDQQTAQAPSENSSVTSSNSGSAAPPVSTGQNTAATTTAPSTAAPAMDPDAATTTAAPPASSTAAAPPAASGTPAPAEEATGAVNAAAAIEPGTYESDRFNLRLEDGGTFTMREKTGNGEITGRYALSGNVLTFQDAQGDTGSTTFPVRCRIAPDGSGFRLADQDGACSGLKDATFKRGS